MKKVLIECPDSECSLTKDDEGEWIEFEKCHADGTGWCRPISKNVYDHSDASDNSKNEVDLRNCDKLKGPAKCACKAGIGWNSEDPIPPQCLPAKKHAKADQLLGKKFTASDIAERFCASLDHCPRKICKALESDLGK